MSLRFVPLRGPAVEISVCVCGGRGQFSAISEGFGTATHRDQGRCAFFSTAHPPPLSHQQAVCLF